VERFGKERYATGGLTEVGSNFATRMRFCYRYEQLMD
jgi:hypothetical protein